MSKYSFSPHQRHAVWTVHLEKCYLCTKPIDLLSMQVDHIIPESLLDSPQELSSVLASFGLSKDFEINSYSNWLPSCASCNRKKSNNIFTPSPLIQVQIESAINKADKAQSIAEKSAKQRDITKALNVLMKAHSEEGLSEEIKYTLKPLVEFQEQERSKENTYYGIRLAPNYEVSPGRQYIIKEITQYLGHEFVLITPPESLVLAFDIVYRDTEKHRMHPSIPINGGAMTGLRSVGLINQENKLTEFGVRVFKTIAAEQKI
ncbi:HNH endonuclease [Vibrio gallaecicus]|uniref:HNH endonuclease n=1 Tax=Vibrio gallaecicus TaxID=552386 RepID=UPI0010C9C535|nr:HNH endonuclease signature motif containing protein [Vibrio gallaecicus]MDN3617492.1 HNH endonuclease signature motif containing protein [Vibrio gallaecicus]